MSSQNELIFLSLSHKKQNKTCKISYHILGAPECKYSIAGNECLSQFHVSVLYNIPSFNSGEVMPILPGNTWRMLLLLLLIFVRFQLCLRMRWKRDVNFSLNLVFAGFKFIYFDLFIFLFMAKYATMQKIWNQVFCIIACKNLIISKEIP